MTIEKRLDNLEQATQAGDPEAFPNIQIYLGWEPGHGYITVDGERMLMSQIDRRWPGWRKLPIDLNVSWGADDDLSK